MTFSASQFKSNLKQGGARPSLFSVELLFPSQIVNPPTAGISNFLVKGASIPASTVGSFQVFYHGKPINVAGDRTFDAWETTIINDEDYSIRIAIEQWMDLISNHVLNTRNGEFSSKEGEDADYKRTIKVTQYKKDGEEAWHYHFIGAFPTLLGAITLDWATSEIEEYTVTWTYDRWMPGTAPHLLASDSHAT